MAKNSHNHVKPHPKPFSHKNTMNPPIPGGNVSDEKVLPPAGSQGREQEMNRKNRNSQGGGMGDAHQIRK